MEKIEENWRENMNTLNEKWKIEYKKLQVAYEKMTSNCR
jgi:hypothetical protein